MARPKKKKIEKEAPSVKPALKKPSRVQRLVAKNKVDLRKADGWKVIDDKTYNDLTLMEKEI